MCVSHLSHPFVNPFGLRPPLQASGQPKVALAVQSRQELTRLQVAAGADALPFFACLDAGCTEVAASTKTVLAIGPAPAEDLDRLTGTLTLYK